MLQNDVHVTSFEHVFTHVNNRTFFSRMNDVRVLFKRRVQKTKQKRNVQKESTKWFSNHLRCKLLLL